MSEYAITLCRLSDLPLGGSRGFSVSTASVQEDVFLVRTAAGVFAYRNSCPHTGAPLDWVPDRFLTLDGDFIQCANHDALFRIEDGHCVKGPCAGRALGALDVALEGEWVVLVFGGADGAP